MPPSEALRPALEISGFRHEDEEQDRHLRQDASNPNRADTGRTSLREAMGLPEPAPGSSMNLPGRSGIRSALVALALSTSLACYPARLPPPDAAPRPVAESSPPNPDPTASNSAVPVAERVVELALASIGRPYEWGGTDSNGFDCSGLIQFAYGEYGIRLPRVSRDQIRAGSPVGLAPDLLRPGDILGFSREVQGETSHVGLYVGDDRFIHSSTTGVRISDLTDPYWQERLVAARRVVP